MKLIDKAAVVAEIERMFNEVKKSTCESDTGIFYAMKHLRSFLDTLEVKEVNLNEEIEKCLKKYSMLAVGKKDFTEIARYFFELGLKQSSSDEYKLGESEIYLNDDGGEPPYDGKQWLDLSCTEYEIPSDKFKDGDNVEIIICKIKKGETK